MLYFSVNLGRIMRKCILWHVRLAVSTQSDQPLLGTLYESKVSSEADNSDYGKTVRIRKLIWVFAWHITSVGVFSHAADHLWLWSPVTLLVVFCECFLLLKP